MIGGHGSQVVGFIGCTVESVNGIYGGQGLVELYAVSWVPTSIIGLTGHDYGLRC